MRKGDKVYISCEDGDHSIYAIGVIISSAQSSNGIPARHCVEYKSEEWPNPIVTNWFIESDLKKVE